MSQKSRARARKKRAERHRAETARSVEGVPAYSRGVQNESGLDERERPRGGPSDDELEAEPNRENRPAIEELIGISEFQVRSASPLDAGDPITSVIADVRDGQKPGVPEEPLTVDPDELGANFLRGAVQDPGPIDEPPVNEIRGRFRTKRVLKQSLRVAKQRKTTRRAT